MSYENQELGTREYSLVVEHVPSTHEVLGFSTRAGEKVYEILHSSVPV